MSVPPELLAQLQNQQAGPQIPPELLAQLGVSGAPGQSAAGGGYGYGDDMTAADPLATLQQCIQALPAVIAALPDPRDTQDATKALLILTGIQTRLMSPQTPQGAPGPPSGAGGY
jgi:hypothetical protein